MVNLSPAQRLDVNGNICVGPASTNLGCIEDRDSTVIAGTCSSDIRLKEKVTAFGKTLDKLSRLRPVNFFWRAAEFPDRHFGHRQSFGLIAQEVEALFPDLVSRDEQGFKTVNYSKLPLLTIQAVKELKIENDAPITQLGKLQRKLGQQEQAITELRNLFRQRHRRIIRNG